MHSFRFAENPVQLRFAAGNASPFQSAIFRSAAPRCCGFFAAPGEFVKTAVAKTPYFSSIASGMPIIANNPRRPSDVRNESSFYSVTMIVAAFSFRDKGESSASAEILL
jgi:hypothetical protein